MLACALSGLGVSAPAAGADVSSKASPAGNGASASGAKVLRYAFPVAETGFDPAQVTDLYSNIVIAHMFEAH